MKKIKYAPSLLLILFASLIFTGCIIHDDDYYQPDPPSYQHFFSEEFNSDTRGWAFDDPIDSAYALVTNGQYKMVDYSYFGGYNIPAVYTGANINRDFLVQTILRSNYAMALVFGVSNSSYGYSFFIDGTGYYAVYKEGASPQTIIDWTYSSAISSGWNDVEMEQVNDYWYFYVNGAKVAQTPARALAGSQIGFMVLPGTTGYAEYLRVNW